MYSSDILQKVYRAPIDWIIFSIDGSDEEKHSQIRGDGNLHQTVESMKYLRSRNIRFRINTLIRKGHFKYRHLKPIVKLCEQLEIESLNCIPLRPLTNDPRILDLQLKPTEFKEFIEGLNRLRYEYSVDLITTLDLRLTTEQDRLYIKDRSCAAGREGCVISPFGEVYGCSYSPASIPDYPDEHRKKYVAGDLTQNGFLNIWNQSERWEIYRDLDTYKNEKCKACIYYRDRMCIGNCPIMVNNDPAAFDPYCYLHVRND